MFVYASPLGKQWRFAATPTADSKEPLHLLAGDGARLLRTLRLLRRTQVAGRLSSPAIHDENLQFTKLSAKFHPPLI
jgi:hypothetical protein